MNILILEDSLGFINIFQKILKSNNLFKDAHFFCVTKEFENIDYLLEYRVVFIDLHLGNINGIELAKKIKSYSPKSLIVFVTANENLVFDTLEIRPFYFMRKNHLKNDMITFFKIFGSYIKDNYFIAFSDRQKIERINVSDIIYVESIGHYLNIVTLDDTYKKKEKISDFQKQVENIHNFVQIHRSYLVNMNYIYEVKNKYIVLINKKEINIGKSYKKEFKIRFQQYLLNGGL